MQTIFTPLHLAAKNGWNECVDILLSQGGANIDDMDEISEFTALHYACKFNHISTAVLLIDRGANSHVVTDPFT